MKPKIDYSLYVVSDQQCISTGSLEEVLEEAILGGCTLVQLREKELSSLAFYQLAKRVREITTQYDIPLIINDRMDIAYAVNADGVHLGQEDLPCLVARQMLGPDKIIGISVHTLKEAQLAWQQGADYLGVGAMFTTATKTDAKLTSMLELQQICKQVDIPIVVIGGINKKTIPLFKDIEIDGIAVVSAILAKDNPRVAATELKTMFINRKNIL